MKLRDLLKGTPAHPPVTVMPAPRCTATTKTGSQCKFPPKPGTDRCSLPSHQRTT